MAQKKDVTNTTSPAVYKAIIHLSAAIVVLALVCLGLDVTQFILAIKRTKNLPYSTISKFIFLLFLPDVVFCLSYFHYAKAAIAALALLKSSAFPLSSFSVSQNEDTTAAATAATAVDNQHSKNSKNRRRSRIAGALIRAALALVEPCQDIARFLDITSNSDLDADTSFTATGYKKADFFFCAGDPAQATIDTDYSVVVRQCRVHRSRVMVCFILVLLALIEIGFYLTSDIDAQDKSAISDSNDSTSSADHSADPKPNKPMP
ncbi:hypothetical protein BGZ83_006787 [Gryganskiella cystojenkinii]|nr:hypothetical protein BGZ83_006787 [Gryganskiella cystojenkinii]